MQQQMTNLILAIDLEKAISQLVAEYLQTLEYTATLCDQVTHTLTATALREQTFQEAYAAGIRHALTIISEKTGVQ